MAKRILDFCLSLCGLILSLPLLVPAALLVWWGDKHNPFYVAPRIGIGGRKFPMVKLRSMCVGADKSKVDSTSANDSRITPIGQIIRAYKLDELTQLWNVLKGDMSLVGPRPNVESGTILYTETEKDLLSVKPGITDFSSIVFADEGEILKDEKDPDIAYNQLVRPWKSRLGLLYVRNANFLLDLKLIILTVVSIFDRKRALLSLQPILERLGCDAETLRVARRQDKLIASVPPGATEVVTSRGQVVNS